MAIDPTIIKNILLGVTANGLSTIITYGLNKIRKVPNSKTKLIQHLDKNRPLSSILSSAAISISQSLRSNDVNEQKLLAFFASPDIDMVTRQIYASKLIPGQNFTSTDHIRDEFIASLALHIGKSKSQINQLGKYIFDSLIHACNIALEVAIGNGTLSALDAKSDLRYRMLCDELVAIKRNLDLLTAKPDLDIAAIFHFEEQYRKQVATRHGFIMPPHIDSAQKIPVDKLYVCPSFSIMDRREEEEKNTLKLQEFLTAAYRAVLLGNPGGGKSTLTNKLCSDLATKYGEVLFAGRRVTPIPVIIREYGAQKKEHSCSILQFIESIANSRYQVAPPPGAFEYLLLNGHAVVIFDGLDELLDTSYRQEISADVESFCTLYPSVPVLVTSREVGYEQAPLDVTRFTSYRLAPFNKHQVKEYVRKWFCVNTDLTSDQQEQTAEAFFRESNTVPDLQSNPLMLALMCNIYRGENYIPRNRPDIYEKCANMLFDRWDKSRNIHSKIPFEAHVRFAMMHIAYWIYSEDNIRDGVTERQLISKSADYLYNRLFDSYEEAEIAAEAFIHFCRGRAWVFTDIGTTKDGERLYQFTHTTFLEYFAAAHLVRTQSTPDALVSILIPRILKREWDVVAQLAFQLQNKNIDGAGDKLLDAVITKAYKVNIKRKWNLLSFANRCLGFLVPSPGITRKIALACVDCCIDWGLNRISENKMVLLPMFKADPREEPTNLLGSLLSASVENRGYIIDYLEMLLLEHINTGNDEQIIVAFEIVLNLEGFWFRNQFPGEMSSEYRDTLCQLQKRILDSTVCKLSSVCSKSFRLSLEAFYANRLSINEMVAFYGVSGLFDYSDALLLPVWRVPISFGFTDRFFSSPPSANMSDIRDSDFQTLAEIGRILLNSTPPWIHNTKQRSNPFWDWRPHERFSREGYVNYPYGISDPDELCAALGPDGLFGFIALCGAILDEEYLKHKTHIEHVKNNKAPIIQLLGPLLVGRFENINSDTLKSVMQRCKFTEAQRNFIMQWIEKDINLVEKSVKK